MFGTILITVISVLHLYVFWRIRSIDIVRKHMSDKTLLVTMCALLSLFIISREAVDEINHQLAIAVELAGMNWMGCLFLLASCFFIADVVTGYGFAFAHFVQPVRIAALCFGGLLSIIAHIQGLREPVVKTYHIEIAELEPALDGTKIVALTDTHLGRLIGAKWMKELAEKVNALEPDIIVAVGDIFDGHDEITPGLVKSFNLLAAPMGVYGVTGNHDDHKDSAGRFEIERTKAELLFNQNTTVTKGLVLAGIEDPTGHARGRRTDDIIKPVLDNAAKGVVVLLSHAPWRPEYAASLGADIMISGHTHNGQIWPFNYLVKERFPYITGLYNINQMKLIVSRGAGTWGPRLRLWQAGEISEIILHKNKSPKPSE